MSLKELMGAAQAQGRGPDSMLVHMSPREVSSLQTLAQAHGGSLTTNPSTGLPEAGFLDAILPAVAGIGLSMIPGVGPLAAGAMVGGATALMSGSLEKGLTAGLGAFGGAGLGAGLAGAGAASASGAQLAGAGANAAMGASTAVPNLANVTAGSGLNLGATMGGAGSMAAPAMSATVNPALNGALNQAMTSAGPAYSMAQPSMMQGAAANARNMGSGLQQLFSSPGQTLDQMGGLGNVGMNAAMALGPAMAAQQPEEEEFLDPNRGYIRPYTFERNRVEGGGNGQRYFDTRFIEHDPVRPEDFQGYAEGGLAAITRGGQAWMPSIAARAEAAADPEQVMAFTRVALPEGDPSGRKFEQRFELRDMTAADREAGLVPYHVSTPAEADAVNSGKNPRTATRGAFGLDPLGFGSQGLFMAADGTYSTMNPAVYGGPTRGRDDPYAYSGFNNYAEGGIARLVDGPGDGLSDDVPAIIDGQAPAALSTDEFVVPADVVSKLGNGSSNAGAKKLHDMMDRIRTQAHGTKKQQRKVNAKKALPA